MVVAWTRRRRVFRADFVTTLESPSSKRLCNPATTKPFLELAHVDFAMASSLKHPSILKANLSFSSICCEEEDRKVSTNVKCEVMERYGYIKADCGHHVFKINNKTPYSTRNSNRKLNFHYCLLFFVQFTC